MQLYVDLCCLLGLGLDLLLGFGLGLEILCSVLWRMFRTVGEMIIDVRDTISTLESV